MSATVPHLLPATRELLPGFERRRITTSGAEINLAVGGFPISRLVKEP